MRALWLFALCGGALGGTTTDLWPVEDNTGTTSTSSTSTSTTAYAGCGGVARCLDDQQCAECLLAINNTNGFTHSVEELSALEALGAKTFALRAYQVGFFETLLSTASCSTNVTRLGILYPALLELSEVSSCVETFGMVVGRCILSECVKLLKSLTKRLF